jgi:hypothetical protein
MKLILKALPGLILFAFLLTACNFPLNGPITPTPNVTQAYATIQAEILTKQPLETAAALGTIIPTQATPSPTGVLLTREPQTPIPTMPIPTAICDRIQPGNPIDVTIPDDTSIPPGESFVKTWRLLNAGNCAWNSNYAVVWFSGEQFADGRSYAIDQVVNPGTTIDISIEMTAPESAGTYQSNWKLQNSSGQLFGIGPTGNSPFWVRIIVPSVITVTVTPTVTPTKTPSVVVNGTILLTDGKGIILSNGTVGDASSSDIVLQSEQIVAQNGTKMSNALAVMPDFTTCSSQPLNTTTISLSSMFKYFCFKDGANHLGWFRIQGFDTNKNLAMDLLTWGN